MTTNGNSRSAHMLFSNSDSPMYAQDIATYIGLRVKRYGPLSTIAVVGRPAGRTVVLAWRKLYTLASPIAIPVAMMNEPSARTSQLPSAIGHGRLEWSIAATIS